MASNAAESSSSKLEFDVNMTCNSCASKVQQSLETIGVKKFDIDVQNQSVVVDTDIPFAKVLGAIQATGKKAVLKGYGSPQGTSSKPSAVAEIFSTSGIMGVVRFSQISDRECVIDGTIDGLSDGVHRVEIHELGDLSNGCESTGDVYEPRTGVVGNSQFLNRDAIIAFRSMDALVKWSQTVLGEAYLGKRMSWLKSATLLGGHFLYVLRGPQLLVKDVILIQGLLVALSLEHLEYLKIQSAFARVMESAFGTKLMLQLNSDYKQINKLHAVFFILNK
ncbi:copper chaperone for superoxide dismutase-like isoform X1 [Ornithodoros turicata]|uniref:copper chaperone for superoxide dismutase-like isoform X1 n=1 Tax=Ornithodoros turicata TaxID=34597 RepID=UPI0031390CF7